MQTSRSFKRPSLIVDIHHPLKTPSPFSELQQFRRNVEEEQLGPHHRPYEDSVSKTRFYRLIFFSIGLLFMALTIVLTKQRLHWSWGLIFEQTELPKFLGYIFSMGFGSFAFWLAATLKPEREAIVELISRSKKLINRRHRQKVTALRLDHRLNFRMRYERTIALRQILKDFAEKVERSREITLNLLKQISKRASEERLGRARLYNQAILELNERLIAIVSIYESRLDDVVQLPLNLS